MFAKHYTLCSRSQPNEMEKIRKAVSILVPKMQKKSVNHWFTDLFVDPQGLKLNNTTQHYTTILLIFNALQKLIKHYISIKHSEQNQI